MAGGADGSFDAEFLTIPPEVIRATIRNNQKCFVVRDPKTGAARQQVHPRRQHRGERRRQGDRRRQRARDPRAAVGRQVLLRDRSEDAGWKTGCRSSSTSCSTRSSARRPSGSRGSTTLAGRSCAAGRSRRRQGRARGAACKADLLTEVVGEFPEVQGLMGRYYARGAGRGRGGRRTPCEDHYKPQGPDDLVPADPVSVAVALADKIDTLVGLLGDRREADRIEGSLCAAACRARRDPVIIDNKLRAELFGLAGTRRKLSPDRRRRRLPKHDAHGRSARLLRRPPEGPTPRAGRAARSRRCRVRARQARTISC